MIGVQEEDIFGKCETCPATGLKDTCHKSNHPKERLRGRFALCHPSLIEAPPLFYSQDGTTEGGSLAACRKRSLGAEINSGFKHSLFPFYFLNKMRRYE